MLGTRWQPLFREHELGRLQREMDKLFRSAPRRSAGEGYPALNVWKDEDAYHIEAEVPGLRSEDVEILVNEGTELTLKFERKEPAGDDVKWRKKERVHGKFSRRLDLPEEVDAERVVASLTDGVLSVRLPKRAEVRPRRISVTCN